MYEMAAECTYLRQHIQELEYENERLIARFKDHEKESVVKQVVMTLNTTTEKELHEINGFMMNWLNRLIGVGFEIVGCHDGGKHVYSYRERR